MTAPAAIIEHPQNREVDVFKNVSLYCTPVGKPQPNITWTKSDGTPVDFTDGRVKLLDDGTLFIQRSYSVTFKLCFVAVMMMMMIIIIMLYQLYNLICVSIAVHACLYACRELQVRFVFDSVSYTHLTLPTKRIV